jgi:enoyl-CoA hydratase
VNQDGQTIELRLDAGIAHITVVNPTRRNALTLDMARSLGEICSEVSADGSVGAVVLSGAGGYFCSGADTSILDRVARNPASDESLAVLSTIYAAFDSVQKLPVPTIAAVDGGALGAGLNLALSADLMLVTPGALIESGFSSRGIHPGGGHLALLANRVGVQSTVAMACMGRPLRGDEAVARGLAWECVPEMLINQRAAQLLQAAAVDPVLTRAILRSLRAEVAAKSSDATVATEIERGMQMWSLGRRSSAGSWREGHISTGGEEEV